MGIMMTIEDFADLIGLTLEDAESVLKTKDMVIRPTQEDGEHLCGTADFRMDRVNVAIKNNIVTSIICIG
jgi:hypothetical protein